LTTPTFNTITSGNSGGIAYITGTSVTITSTTLNTNTVLANNGFGAGFALVNTADTTISITGGTIATKI
jgi:hypothetical protein